MSIGSGLGSGVLTRTCSNESLVQEKLYKMDLEIPPRSTSVSAKKSALEEEDRNQPHSSCEIKMVDSEPGMSLTHLQPASLIHGYEYSPTCPQRGSIASKFNHILLNMMNTKKIAGCDSEFVSSSYTGCQLKPKMDRWHHSPLSVKFRRNNSCPTNYLKLRETMRMCRAACHNNTEAMREMLSAGVSPNCHDWYNRSPLHLAACMGYADMVKLLLDHGADPNAKDSIGNTPLHLAACTNHVSVITLLLKAGTRVSERDLAGHSPLQLAITKFNIMKRSIVPHPVLKEQVCQVITMLTEYMRRKEGATINPELLNQFESLVRVSDSSEEVESNIRDLLSSLSSLSLSGNN